MDIVDRFVNLSIRVGSTFDSLGKIPENLRCVLMTFQGTASNPQKPSIFEAQKFLESAGSWLSVTAEELVREANLIRPALSAQINLQHLSDRICRRREEEKLKRKNFALRRERELVDQRIDTSKDEQFMKEAIDCARVAEEIGEVPVGAVVVDENGIVIGRGYNKVIANSDPTAHAEIMAIRQAAQRKKNYRLDNCSLYVTLEPCPMCAGAIMNSRFARLIYGAPDEKGGVVENGNRLFDNKSLNHHTKVRSRVCSEDCLGLLQEFFIKKRKKES